MSVPEVIVLLSMVFEQRQFIKERLEVILMSVSPLLESLADGHKLIICLLKVSSPSGHNLSVVPLTCSLRPTEITTLWDLNEKHGIRSKKHFLNQFSSPHLLGLQRRPRRNDIPLHTCPLGQDPVAALAWRWVCWKQRWLCWGFCRSFDLRPAQRRRFVHADAWRPHLLTSLSWHCVLDRTAYLSLWLFLHLRKLLGPLP